MLKMIESFKSVLSPVLKKKQIKKKTDRDRLLGFGHVFYCKGHLHQGTIFFILCFFIFSYASMFLLSWLRLTCNMAWEK